jgi:RNA 3'-terminal phosphate cyclase-like protein
MEPLIALAPFGKLPLELTITGITNDNVDISVDLIRTVLLPQLTRFGITDNLELKVLKRGARPGGGGQVLLRISTIKTLKPVSFTDPGRIKRIRGIAYCTRISPLMANRMQESARALLTPFVPDVYIYTDVFKGAESGFSPGYALSLVAESETGALISTECAYRLRTEDAKVDAMDVQDMLVNEYTFPTPEDLGVRAARQLLVEIKKGGSVDTISQTLNLLLIALGPEDVGKVRFGSLTQFTYIQLTQGPIFTRY